MTNVIILARVISQFKVGDDYFIRCYDNGFFIKCLISEEQYNFLEEKRKNKALYLITGYYIKYRHMIIIKVDTIESFDYKNIDNICNINNPKYDLSVMQNFEQIKEKKVSK